MVQSKDILIAWIVGVVLAILVISCSEKVSDPPVGECFANESDSSVICGETKFHMY